MTDLYYRPRETPGPLPAMAFTIDDEPPQARTDLANHPDSLVECGFKKAPPRPADTDAQTVAWDHDAEAWIMVDRPPAPPAPEPEPLTLGKLQFIVLAQTAGGMTDQMLVDAQKNPAFEAFWIKFQMASAVERDDPITRGALDALAGGGYLPQGKPAVLAAWPLG